MKLIESIKHFWFVTLGEDYPTENTLEQEVAGDASLQELIKSQERINKMESSLKNTTAPKSGKAGKIVETVVISPEAVKKMQEIKEAKVKEDEGNEIAD